MVVERIPEDPFVHLSTALIRNPDLSNTGFRTYALLLSYRWQNDSCFPSQERLSSDSGMTRKTIRAGLAELVDLGLITQQRRGQRYCNLYSFPDGSNLPIRHDSDEQKVPISIAQWGKKDPSDGVKITQEIETKKKDSVIAADSPTVLQQVCQRLGIKKDIRAEELVEQSMANRPGTNHVERALKCIAWYDADWSKKSEIKRAGHYATFCKNEENPLPAYTVKATASNGGSSPSEYVRWDAEIKATIPQFKAVFTTIRSWGTCPAKRWSALESLGEHLKADGTLLFLARSESEKERAERLYKDDIDSACREHGFKFAFGVAS